MNLTQFLTNQRQKVSSRNKAMIGSLEDTWEDGKAGPVASPRPAGLLPLGRLIGNLIQVWTSRVLALGHSPPGSRESQVVGLCSSGIRSGNFQQHSIFSSTLGYIHLTEDSKRNGATRGVINTMKGDKGMTSNSSLRRPLPAVVAGDTILSGHLLGPLLAPQDGT
ncbi:hypothetical protein EI94DRAFT_1695769 [Lactarius quietus]|nr:hypothetical protein EI94DRAFT_1695769 [Lactarius quietus]